MNKIQLTGRLTKNPETRYTDEGKSITTFTLAINNSKDDTTFIKITCFAGTGELIQKYCKKGDLILVDGMVRNNNYTDKDGNKHFDYVFIGHKVEFLSKSDNNPKTEENAKKGVQNELNDEVFK